MKGQVVKQSFLKSWGSKFNKVKLKKKATMSRERKLKKMKTSLYFSNRYLPAIWLEM